MIEFVLPEVSEGVESVDVAEVLVQEGDTIESGQNVLEIETDKAVVELPCEHAGKIAKVHVAAGDTVKVGQVILSIEESSDAPTSEGKGDGDSAKKQADDSTSKKDARKDVEPDEPKASRESTADDASESKSTSAPAATRVERGGETSGGNGAPHTTTATLTVEGSVLSKTTEERSGNPPPPAAPSTRRLARKLGVDLHVVAGSGRGGRITVDDVQAFVRGAMTVRGTIATGGAQSGVSSAMVAPALPDFTKFGPVSREKMGKIARVSANNLAYSWNTIPHVTQHDLVDVTDIEAARKQYMATLGKNGPKITMTAIAAKAVVTALKAFPHFNSSLDLGTGELVLKGYYHVGIAVDTEHGLLVPVVRDCDKKSVVEIAAEVNALAERARDRKISMDDLQGATFTITNLGGIGGTSFTPIVNHPEVAILGMSRYQKAPAIENGQLVERLLLPLSLSYDHRVVNGADAARFIVKLNHALSNFFTLAIEG